MTSAPKGKGGLVKCWQNLTLGEGGFDQWWRQQKRTFCCNPNKYKNKNTQLLNLSSNSAILPNMIFYGTKMCIRQVSAGCNFFRYKFRENYSQKGGGVCSGLTSLLRGGVQSLTNADIGGRGGQKAPKICWRHLWKPPNVILKTVT